MSLNLFIAFWKNGEDYKKNKKTLRHQESWEYNDNMKECCCLPSVLGPYVDAPLSIGLVSAFGSTSGTMALLSIRGCKKSGISQ